MRITRRVLCTAVLLAVCLASLSMTGCSALRQAASGPLHINLPRLHITYSETGEPSILGIGLSSIQRLVPADMSMLRLSAEQMQQLAAWNLQHIELAVAADGVFVFVNNLALPHLRWTAGSLDNLGLLADELDMLPATVAPYISFRRALPMLLTTLGSGIHLQFPVPAGQAPIVFMAHPSGSVPTLPQEVEDIGLAVHLPLEYDQAGQASLEGIRLQELGQLTGQSVAIAQLDQPTMDTISKVDVQRLVVRMEARGLVPYVNGQEMPYLSWADQDLVNLIDLAETIGLAETLPGGSQVMDLLRQAASGVRKADIQLSADFGPTP
jgi:hypothetical protein